MRRRERHCFAFVTNAGNDAGHVQSKLDELPESALRVLGAPARLKCLASPAELLCQHHLHLEHERPRRRLIPLHGMGARCRQQRNHVQLPGLQRLIRACADLQVDDWCVYIGHGCSFSLVAPGQRHQHHLHRQLERLRQSSLPVLDPASRRELADRQGLFVGQYVHLEHDRPCAGQLHVHRLGARRGQHRHAVQLPRLQ